MAGLWDTLRNLASTFAASAGGNRGRAAQMDEHIVSQIGRGEPGLAAAVIRAGQIVYAAGHGMANLKAGVPVAPDSIFHLASCGKQFTGLGIMMLAEAGRLRLDDPVGQHIPELTGFGPKVTLRRLLHHTSGIFDLHSDYGMEKVRECSASPTNADVIQAYVNLGCPMVTFGAEPGETFAYSNTGYELLGSVIERASGQSYHDFFQQRVFDPLGMKDTFSVPDRRAKDRRCALGYYSDDSGRYHVHQGDDYDNLNGSGWFYTTVIDLCRYDRALATNALISARSLRESVTSGRTNDGTPTDYGFGWYVGTYEGMRYCDHDGDWNAYNTYICRYLDHPLSIFVLSGHPGVDVVEVANLATELYS